MEDRPGAEQPLTIHEHVMAVYQTPAAMAALVAALRADDAFTEEARQELARLTELERVRPNACWISKITKNTLTAALAAI